MNLTSVMERAFRRGRDLVRTDVYNAALQAYDDVWRRFPWPFRIVTGQISAVADVTTSTVSVTQGIASITFATDPGQSAVGKHVRVSTDYKFYRLESYSGSGVFILSAPYEGTTTTTGTYTLRQYEFRLPVDFDVLHTAMHSAGLSWVDVTSLRDLEISYRDPWSLGVPHSMAPCGSTRTTLYNTGSVETTRGLATLTLTGGTWDSSFALRRFVFREQPELGWFKLKSIDTATTATLDRAYLGREGSGLLYDIDPAGEPLVRLYPQPNPNTSVEFTYYRALPALQGIDDWPQLPSHYHEVWAQATMDLLEVGRPGDYERHLKQLLAREGLGRFGIVRAGALGATRMSGMPKGILPDGYPFYRPRGR